MGTGRLEYGEISIELRQAENRVTASVLVKPPDEDESVKKATSDFVLPVSPDEIEEAFKQIRSSSVRQYVTRSESPQAVLDPIADLGDRLFNAVVSGRVIPLYRQYLGPNNRTEGMRLRLVIASETGHDLSALPWEFLFDRVRNDFVALSLHSPLCRGVLASGGVSPNHTAGPAQPPVSVLVVVSPFEGIEQVQKEINVLKELPQLRVEVLPNPTFAEVAAHLSGNRYQIIHFIGTGNEFDSAPALLLRDVDGLVVPHSPESLLPTLQAQTDLRLIHLSACHTDRVAQRLAAGVPAAVGMRGVITNEACLTFATGLYEALVEGQPLDAAVAMARQRIDDAYPAGWEWAVPVLHMQGGSPFAITVADVESVVEDPVIDGEAQMPPASRAERARLRALLSVHQKNLKTLKEQERGFEEVPQFLRSQIDTANTRIESIRGQLKVMT